MGIQDKHHVYNYEDFLLLEGQWELIDGEVYDMTPGASIRHQDVSGQLFAKLFSYHHSSDVLKKCSVFHPPTDVRFSECHNYDVPDHVVQPDLMVVCNTKQISEKSVNGAPDLIVEILSPSTALKDRNVKYNLYEKFGVREYWIVDPIHMTVEVYALVNERFIRIGNFGQGDTILSNQFPHMHITL